MTAPGSFVAGDVLSAADMNALPGGVVDFVSTAVNQTGITTETDVTSLTSTQTYVAGRRLRITVHLTLTQVTSTGNQRVVLQRGGVSILGQMYEDGVTTTAINQDKVAVFVTTSVAGSQTYKIRASTSAGTLTIANATNIGYMLIEDIGIA